MNKLGTDGAKWAAEFCRIFGSGNAPFSTVDEDLMLAWFANAIEAGRDAGLAVAEAHREQWNIDSFTAHVLQCAFDLAEEQHGYDLGVQGKEPVNRAYRKFMDACADLAAENDGKLRIRKAGA